MPDDVGGKPFQNGWEPNDDRGGADEEFASVVFDEDFVRAATIKEPTAVERLLAAAEAEAARARAGGLIGEDDPYDEFLREVSGPGGRTGDYGDYRGLYGRGDLDGLYGDPDDGESGPYGPHGGVLRPYRGRARWHRPVAWLLALVMGIGMVALAFAAVYRGAASSRQDPAPPPATSGVEVVTGGLRGAGPSASAHASARPVPAAPRTH
ncbi:hypothetical protein AB0436_03750 [Streptomyces sp. NPDC051322]|uniref:SCO2584 family spore wall biosynthesis protein n=1 Tax=Streptomyces sp. NPDC051322 TaxID=3154645 RepID=UPI00344E26D3